MKTLKILIAAAAICGSASAALADEATIVLRESTFGAL